MAPAEQEQDQEQNWYSTIAHKICINYWVYGKGEDMYAIGDNVPISELSFFNALLSEPLRRNEMRIVVGEFLRHLIQMNLAPQPGGTSLDDAFNQLVEIFTAGTDRISVSGDMADAVYSFEDEV